MNLLSDYQKEIEHINIQFAIRGEVRTSLTDILPLLTKDKLAYLASEYGLPGRSKLKKGELAARLFEYGSDVSYIGDTLLIADDREWDLFEKLLDSRYLQSNIIPFGHYRYLLDRGLVFTFYAADKLYFVVPEEIKAACRTLTSFPVKTRARYLLVGSYIRALTNLYGAFEPEKLIEIFNAQNSTKPNEDEFNRIYIALNARMQPYWMYAGRIVSDYFDDENNDELMALLEKTKGKPYYVPGREELLKNADNIYFAMTPELAALRNYILKNMCSDAELVEGLIDDIQLHCSMEESMQAVISEFERRDISFAGMEQVRRLVPLIMDVYNNTRIWSNRGYTPNEAASRVGRSPVGKVFTPLRVLVGGQSVAEKVGRNDPCPCGSGKKYKKCCGR